MILNLAYHSISRETYEHAVTPANFEKQMLFLQRHFSIISTSELAHVIQEQQEVTKPLATVSFDDGIEDNYTEAFPILKKLNIPATIFIVTSYVNSTQTYPSGSTFRFLSWEQMKEMKASGLIDIQSHTHTHPLLTMLDDEAIAQELLVSKQEIEHQLKNKVNAFAYPKGKYDARVIKNVRKYYDYAFGPLGIMTSTKQVDTYAIPRIIVSANIPLWKFKSMTTLLYWKIKKIRDLVHNNT